MAQSRTISNRRNPSLLWAGLLCACFPAISLAAQSYSVLTQSGLAIGVLGPGRRVFSLSVGLKSGLGSAGGDCLDQAACSEQVDHAFEVIGHDAGADFRAGP